jgi:hypothetical protein
MAEGARGGFEAGDVARLGGVFVEHASGLTEIRQPLQRKEAALGQNLKQDRRPMALAEQKPIAIGILWYGFGKDIGNAGPTIARYIPWLVPEHLRGSARWRYDPKTDSKQKQFDAPANLDAGEFGRIGGNK